MRVVMDEDRPLIRIWPSLSRSYRDGSYNVFQPIRTAGGNSREPVPCWKNSGMGLGKPSDGAAVLREDKSS